MSIKINPLTPFETESITSSTPQWSAKYNSVIFADPEKGPDIEEDDSLEIKDSIERLRSSVHDYVAGIPTITSSNPYRKTSHGFRIGNAALERMSILEKIKAYEATRDKNIIYRMILYDFSNYIQTAADAMGTIPPAIIANTVEQDVIEFGSSLSKQLKYSKLSDSSLTLVLSLKDEILGIYRDFMTSLYGFSNIDKSKKLSICVNNKFTLIKILEICRDKGITLDPAIYNIQNIEFTTDSAIEISILLVYLPSMNTMLYLQYDTGIDYSGMRSFLNNVSDLPDVGEKSEEKEEMIKINDKLYSKKSFESLVETNFDNFVQNLEIDCLLDKKDTDAVVDKLNLL